MIRFRLCLSGRKNKKVMLFFFCLHFFLIGFILLEQFRFTAKCFFVYKLVLSEVAQSCLTLCDPMDCSLPGSSVHGIFQAIVLEWTAISFSRGSSQPRDWTRVSHIVDRRFTVWATREVHLYMSKVSNAKIKQKTLCQKSTALLHQKKESDADSSWFMTWLIWGW